jgi:hypothetical protein
MANRTESDITRHYRDMIDERIRAHCRHRGIHIFQFELGSHVALPHIDHSLLFRSKRLILHRFVPPFYSLFDAGLFQCFAICNARVTCRFLAIAQLSVSGRLRCECPLLTGYLTPLSAGHHRQLVEKCAPQY